MDLIRQTILKTKSCSNQIRIGGIVIWFGRFGNSKITGFLPELTPAINMIPSQICFGNQRFSRLSVFAKHSRNYTFWLEGSNTTYGPCQEGIVINCSGALFVLSNQVLRKSSWFGPQSQEARPLMPYEYIQNPPIKTQVMVST